MRCYVCDNHDWHERKEINMHKVLGVCKTCGNVAFIINDGDEKKVIDYYRSNYRSAPHTLNIVTCNRKLGYIKPFVMDFFKGKRNLICGDVGAGTGYLVYAMRMWGQRATGCEYTKTYRRFSEHYYGVPLTEDLEPKHKYDFISMYHVLEHMVDPYSKLMNYKNMLSDKGVMFISVPEWFYDLEDLSAICGLEPRGYFHENHINCFSRKSFHNLLKRAGMKIVKEDYEVYGQTVIVEPYKNEKVQPMEYENWEEVNKKIDDIIKAMAEHKKGYSKEATDIWYRFPEAHLKVVFDKWRKDPGRQEAYFGDLMRNMAGNIRMQNAYALWHYQHQNYEKAIELFNKSINVKPLDDCFSYLGHCYYQTGQHKKAMFSFSEVARINPPSYREMTDLICKIASEMPAWDERAAMEIKDKMFKESKPKIQLVDPCMEPDQKPQMEVK